MSDLTRESQNSTMNLASRQFPDRITLNGLYVRLEPICRAKHGDHLFTASMAPGAEERFKFLLFARRIALDFPLKERFVST